MRSTIIVLIALAGGARAFASVPEASPSKTAYSGDCVTCGAGTLQVGGECVPDCGTGTQCND